MEQTILENKVEEAAAKAGGLLRSRYGLWALGAISFAESALPVPLITDPFLVAYILADRTAVVRGVIMTTVSSLLGGIFAYAVAFWFYEFIAVQYLQGAVGEQFYTITEEFQNGTFVITLLGAVTPIPYTLVALAAGFMKGSVPAFLVASLVGRLFRYGIVGWLTYRYGEQALTIARRQLPLVTVVSFIAAILYFYFFH